MKTFDQEITHKEFTDVMNTMAEVFPAINGKARIRYYLDAVKDLPFFAVKEISKHFLTTSKNLPLPNDFLEAAKSWKQRNNYFAKNEILFHEVKCQLCRDSGIVRIIHLTTNEDRMMRCNCFENWRSKHLTLPKFEYSLKQVYKVSPCPLEWFKPSDNNPEGKEFFQKSENYQNRIKQSEKYWKDLGYV